jgi:50S ribosomal protein L16 3-hydroxylase
LTHFARASARRLLPSQMEIDQALGEYLSEPKTLVSFSPPAAPLSERRFLVAAARRGLRLDAGTRLLYDRHGFYVNGETQRCASGSKTLREIADRRALAGQALQALRPGAESSRLLYDWYRAGWLRLLD